jgi:hypothetical protein
MPGMLVESPSICKLFVFFQTHDLGVNVEVNMFCVQPLLEFIPLQVGQGASTDN